MPEPESVRLSRASLECLGRTLDESRRLHVAENRVAEELAALPEDSWLVERDVHIGVRRIPFLVIGATGVFGGPTPAVFGGGGGDGALYGAWPGVPPGLVRAAETDAVMLNHVVPSYRQIPGTAVVMSIWNGL